MLYTNGKGKRDSGGEKVIGHDQKKTAALVIDTCICSSDNTIILAFLNKNNGFGLRTHSKE